MLKSFVLAVMLISTPIVCYASLPGLIADAFGRGGPMYPATLILGISVGSWLIKTACGVVGCGDGTIKVLERVGKVTVVISAVYAMLKTIFELLGI